MKVLYFDCFSGMSGDMTIGALLDAGGDFTHLQEELKKLQIEEEYELKVTKVNKNGITATKFDVILKNDQHEHGHHHHHDDHAHVHSAHKNGHEHHHAHNDLTHEHHHAHGEHGEAHGHVHHHHHDDHGHDHEQGDHVHVYHHGDHNHDHIHVHHHHGDYEYAHVHQHHHDSHHHHGHSHDHHHRSYKDIVAMIKAAGFSEKVESAALQIFKKIGVSEGRIHGVPLEDVHFHEVGAVDSIIDIVGTAILIDQLEVDTIISSPIPVGSGKIHIDHGIYPVPAPATLDILKGVPIAKSDIKGELTTPTGAAIVAVLAKEFGTLPEMTVAEVGYGAGTKTFEKHPNVLRVIIGNTSHKK